MTFERSDSIISGTEIAFGALTRVLRTTVKRFLARFLAAVALRFACVRHLKRETMVSLLQFMRVLRSVGVSSC